MSILVEIVDYLCFYDRVTAYTLILLGCLLFVEHKEEKLSLCTILLFYLLSPIVREEVFRNISIFEYPRDFYIFYAIYECVLLTILFLINFLHRNFIPIYIISLGAIFLNYYIYIDWYNSYWIAQYYTFINRTIMDATIFLIISSFRSKGLIFLSISVFILPELTNYLLQ